MNEREAVREFWSAFLGSKVEKDGQVPGFSEWCKGAHPKLVKMGLRLSWETARHVKRGAPAGEAITLMVSQFRQAIPQFVDNETPTTDRWTAFGHEIFLGVHQHGWKPPQVLDALELSRESMRSEGPIELWISEVRDFGDNWPVQRLADEWLMPDGRKVAVRFPS